MIIFIMFIYGICGCIYLFIICFKFINLFIIFIIHFSIISSPHVAICLSPSSYQHQLCCGAQWLPIPALSDQQFPPLLATNSTLPSLLPYKWLGVHFVAGDETKCRGGRGRGRVGLLSAGRTKRVIPTCTCGVLDYRIN